MGWKDYDGKNIYVSLNTKTGKRFYTGKVIEVIFMGFDENNFELCMFSIIDKFGTRVSFTNKQIEFIEEEKSGENGRQD